MKKSYKILLISTAIVAVLISAASLLVSPIAKSYIEKHSRELIGRPVTMERLHINIFSGRLRIAGLAVGGAQDSTTFFRLDSFEMRLRLMPLLGHKIVVKRIALVRPDLKIYQRGNSFNFDDMLAKFQGDTLQTAPEKPSKPWTVDLRDISIKGGHIFYKDLLIDATWGLNDLGLTIPGIYFAGAKTDVGVLLNFAEGGSLRTSVGYDIATSDFDIGLQLDRLALTGTLPYFQQALDVSGVRGRLSADILLRGNSEHLLSMRAEGSADLADFALLDPTGREVAAIDTLHIGLSEADLQQRRFRFNKIYVAGFSALAEVTPEGNNLTALLKSSGETPSPSAETTPAMEVPQTIPQQQSTFQVADMEVERSSLHLRDLTLSKPFEYRISDIRMRSRNFDPSAHNNLTVEARMQKTGSAKFRWEGVLDNLDNQNITLWLSNIDLRDFTPYSEHYTAYPLTGGNMTFRSQNVIRNRNLDGTNHLDMFEPHVDKKRKDLKPELKIPLKLGLYVLRDKKGHVKMDLPVKGSLDSPEFSYRKIVLRAIGNVLVKVVTAPFSFLSGNNDHLEYIDILPQQYAFSSEQYAAFDRIAQAIQDKPELKITLTQRIDLSHALPAQAQDNLRMAYYNSLQAADSTAEHPRLTMLEYEKIQTLNFKSGAVAAFADSLLRLRGTDPARLTPQAKALALYRDEAALQLRRMMAARDKALADYMVSAHGLTEGTFRIEPMDSISLASYAGPDRYTISLEAQGETVEVSDETALPEERPDKTPSSMPAAPVAPAAPNAPDIAAK